MWLPVLQLRRRDADPVSSEGVRRQEAGVRRSRWASLDTYEAGWSDVTSFPKPEAQKPKAQGPRPAELIQYTASPV